MNEDLSLIISKYRTMRNFSQEKLAESIGVSRQSIVNWEENKSKPSLMNFVKISKKLQIPAYAVIGLEGQVEIFNEVDLGDGIIVIFARQK